MKNSKMNLHIRQTHTHILYMQTPTNSDLSHKHIHNLFHYLSLFGCAVLTHNLDLDSFSLHIKRLIERQIEKIKSSAGFSLGQRASISHTHKITYTHTHTH